MSRSLRILVVENHGDTLLYMRRYLEQLGHVVRTATSLADAGTALGKELPDVLISDIGLPDGEGWELPRSLPAHAGVFAIAMSGYGSEADVRRSREAGFHRHLVKPFDPDDLDALLAEADRHCPAAIPGSPNIQSGPVARTIDET
ncbi:MAG: response regulator [Terrimicrobiaceae bacterium]|nr:response regulator [Terrimicrobiaceae bacterium]